MNGKTENRIQQECVIWFHNRYMNHRGCLFAVPNGGTRSGLEGKILKATGVWAGVSDLLLMVGGVTTCLELKTDVGYQSAKQKRWQSLMQDNSFKYYIIRSQEEFIEIVEPIMEKYGN